MLACADPSIQCKPIIAFLSQLSIWVARMLVTGRFLSLVTSQGLDS
jgi:hypothetical protein